MRFYENLRLVKVIVNKCPAVASNLGENTYENKTLMSNVLFFFVINLVQIKYTSKMIIFSL